MTTASSRTLQLLPHQAAFADLFFSSSAKRIVVLRADVGLGKSTALLAVAMRLLQERPTARALYLVPGSALRAQFVHRLYDLRVPTLEVDRYRFRELLDASTGKDLWPSGMVVVMSREFARQEDVLESLMNAHWDLVLVDEAHQFRSGLSRDVAGVLSTSSERMILATAPLLDLPDVFPNDESTVVAWNRNQIIGFDGKPLQTSPAPHLELRHYGLTAQELMIWETMRELHRALLDGSTQQAWIGRILLQSYESSPASLEAGLQRVNATRDRGEILESASLLESVDEDSEYEPVEGMLGPSIPQNATVMIGRLLRVLEDLGVDSKLLALDDLLKRIESRASSNTRICILTERVATLFYIGSELEDLGHPYRLFHGSMTMDDRHGALDQFSREGGILLATRAALEGVDLREVTDLIFYDVPHSSSMLGQLVLRFDRLGRKTPLNLYGFLPAGVSSDLAGRFDEALQMYRNEKA